MYIMVVTLTIYYAYFLNSINQLIFTVNMQCVFCEEVT